MHSKSLCPVAYTGTADDQAGSDWITASLPLCRVLHILCGKLPTVPQIACTKSNRVELAWNDRL